MTFRLTSRAALLFATAFAATALSTSPGPAFASDAQQMCTGDAMRLCGSFVPDVDRITACMIQRKSELSAECRQYFRPGPEPGEEAARPPTDIKPVARKPVRTKPVSDKAKKFEDEMIKRAKTAGIERSGVSQFDAATYDIVLVYAQAMKQARITGDAAKLAAERTAIKDEIDTAIERTPNMRRSRC